MATRKRVRDLPGLESYQGSMKRYDRNHTTHKPDYGTYTSTLVGPITYTPPASIRGRQVTVDENHKIRNPHSLRGSEGDLGGPFDSIKMSITSNASNQLMAGSWLYDSGATEYRMIKDCPVFAVNPDLLSLVDKGSLRRNLKPLGTTAIARCKPTNHVSDLLNDLSETYQAGLPKLPGRRLWEGHARRWAGIPASSQYFNPGDEYLNVVFGWSPLVADLRDAQYAAVNSHRLMTEYENNSGKTVRRSYTFPPETSTTVEDQGVTEGYTRVDPAQQYGFIDGLMSQPHLLKITKTLRETWFSGSFTYYLPSYYGSRNRIARIAAEAEHLYGLELSPYTLWECAPWTWALDWFSNTGDVISNLTDWAKDGLVLHYGYLMEKISYVETYALDRPCRLKTADGMHAYCAPVYVSYESKQRIRATPFGFEIDWNGLSLRQWAISTALGITKW